jgi:hypothetical protein
MSQRFESVFQRARLSHAEDCHSPTPCSISAIATSTCSRHEIRAAHRSRNLSPATIAVGRTRAAIMSLLLIHEICRTHPARPVQSAEAAPGSGTSYVGVSSTECNPVLGQAREVAS